MKRKDSKGRTGDSSESNKVSKDKRRRDHFVDYYACSLGYGRKKGRRIRSLNWVEGTQEPEVDSEELQLEERLKEEEARTELEEKVEKALDKLERAEREFIRYFYYDCLTYNEISQLMEKTKDRLERIHHSALEKLKFSLKDFVSERYKIKISPERKCLICSHSQRKELEDLIRAKKEEETWKRILRICRDKFGLKIKTPQTLIVHQRKHMSA